jgi:hypothetical protein
METSTKKRTTNAKRKAAPTAWPTAGLATIKEAQTFLRVGRSTMFELLKSGRLRKVIVLKHPRINWEDLWRMARGQSQNSD